MPVVPRSQSHFAHISGLFNTLTLDRVRTAFVGREAMGWQPKDEGERKRVEIGAAPNDFRLDTSWYDVWNDANPAGLAEFGPFTYALFPVHIRHVVKTGHLVPWHQDAAYVALMPKRHASVITCFVPLEPDPRDVSTLEFAVGDYPLLPHEPQDGHGAAIKQHPFPQVMRFDLAFGDALVFGDHVPHRTVPGRDGKIDRRSFEFRLTKPQDALPGKDYFDLVTRKFVQTPETGH
jgi:hypothetical protein